MSRKKLTDRNPDGNKLSRHNFLGTAATAAALTLMSVNFGELSVSVKPLVSAKPDSKFSGAQIGAITYSWRDMPGGVENILKYCN